MSLTKAEQLFVKGGRPWVALPEMERGIARDVFIGVLLAARGKTVITAPDRVLSSLAKVSLRSLQKGLLELEGLGFITRLRWRGGRRITILVRLAGRTGKADLEGLKAMPYDDYLKTAHWQAVREAAIERDGGACRLCSDTQGLNVHHRTYERIGCEWPTDLITLCRKCHEAFHGKMP